MFTLYGIPANSSFFILSHKQFKTLRNLDFYLSTQLLNETCNFSFRHNILLVFFSRSLCLCFCDDVYNICTTQFFVSASIFFHIAGVFFLHKFLFLFFRGSEIQKQRKITKQKALITNVYFICFLVRSKDKKLSFVAIEKTNSMSESQADCVMCRRRKINSSC